MTKRTILCLAGVLLLLFVVAGPAKANICTSPGPGIQCGLDFASNPGDVGGTMSFTEGVGDALSVTNAPIDYVAAVPSTDKVTISSGLLDFITGACYSKCTPVAGQTTLFSNGGSLSLTGKLPNELAPETLLTGVFSNLGLFDRGTQATFTTFSMSGSLLVNNINPDIYAALLAAFPSLSFEFESSSGKGFLLELFGEVTLSGDSFSGTIVKSDLAVVPIPEPATLALLGTGMLGLAGFFRRRRARTNK